MKHIIKVLAVITILASLSCKKLLETAPKDFLDPEEFYNTAEQLKRALTGVYAPLGTEAMYHLRLSQDLAYGNDEGLRSSSATVTGPTVYNYSATEPFINGVWNACYLGINRANAVLDNIDKPLMDSTLREQYKGEALFLRGYYYFVLVDNWGGVPLKLSPSKSADVDVNIRRSSIRQVYEQILTDMTAAESRVARISTLGFSGRISKTAVEGILARVCLTMAGFPLRDRTKYAEAAQWASKVINSGEHALNNDYRQIFINHSKDIYDIKECIWEIEAFGNNSNTGAFAEGSWISTWAGIPANGLQDPGFGYGAIFATAKLYNLYAAGDHRRDWCISPYVWKLATDGSSTKTAVAATNTRYVGKWRREYEALPKAKNYSSTNIPMLRYSDVLLMRAEALTEMNPGVVSQDAIDTVNLVRRRGYGKQLFGDTVVSITLSNQGSGYSQTNLPVVSIVGGGGSGATAVPVVSADGKITSIKIVSGGKFYTQDPSQVTIAASTGSGAVATAKKTAFVAELTSDKTADYSSFIDAIRDERSRELCYEVLRIHDLKRWGIFVSRMKALANEIQTGSPTAYATAQKFQATAGDNIEERHLLWPIPASELSLNNLMVQNPGW